MELPPRDGSIPQLLSKEAIIKLIRKLEPQHPKIKIYHAYIKDSHMVIFWAKPVKDTPKTNWKLHLKQLIKGHSTLSNDAFFKSSGCFKIELHFNRNLRDGRSDALFGQSGPKESNYDCAMRVKNLLSAIFNNKPDVYPMIGLPSSKPIGYEVIGNVSQEASVARITQELAKQNSTPHKEFCSRFKTISDKFFVSTGKLHSETAELCGL